MPGKIPPKNDRSDDEGEENEEREQEEREQAKELRKGEKPGENDDDGDGDGAPESANDSNLSETERLKREVESLRVQLHKAKMESRKAVRASQFRGNNGLFKEAKFSNKSVVEVDEQGGARKMRNSGSFRLHPQQPAAEDPEKEKLLEENPKLDAGALGKFKIQKRAKEEAGRAGFRMLVESREDDSVEIVKVPNGVFMLPTLTKMQVKLKYIKEVRRVLVIKKPGDEETLKAMHDVIRFLAGNGIQIILETSVEKEIELEQNCIDPDETKLSFLEGPEIQHADVDLIICLGGDGTILWSCGLFPWGMPPVVSFKMGSMGFLTPFPFSQHSEILREILKKDKNVTVRARLQVTFKRKGQPDEVMTCLNEVVAKHPSKMVQLDLYNGRHHLTRVHADGLIVATPTGSTAYSLAAGGSMVHPSIPAMVVTPIAPHTLSFRPIVLADSSTIRLVVPQDARTECYVSLDGREPVQLNQGDLMEITVSDYPMAAYCDKSESADWFNTIKESFLWNVRTEQKPMPKVLSEDEI